RLSIVHDGSRGRHVARPLGLDARRELVEPRLFQWRADERADVLTKTWTEPADVEAADVDRADGGAVGHRRPLIRGLRADGEEREEHGNHSHAPRSEQVARRRVSLTRIGRWRILLRDRSSHLCAARPRPPAFRDPVGAWL